MVPFFPKTEAETAGSALFWVAASHGGFAR
jgi:hypothetical protein